MTHAVHCRAASRRSADDYYEKDFCNDEARLSARRRRNVNTGLMPASLAHVESSQARPRGLGLFRSIKIVATIPDRRRALPGGDAEF
jgi:hypothetical protein